MGLFIDETSVKEVNIIPVFFNMHLISIDARLQHLYPIPS